MPPAFLFPESDPPPSDLVPENSSSTASTPSTNLPAGGNVELGNGTGSRSSFSSVGSQDVVDTSAALHNNHQLHLQQQHHQQLQLQQNQHQKSGNHGMMLPAVEEYTLPDLFPQPPVLNSVSKATHSGSPSPTTMMNSNCNYLPSTPSPASYGTQPTNNNNQQSNNKKYYHLQQQLSDGSGNNNYSQQQAYNSSSSNSNDLISPNTNSINLKNNNPAPTNAEMGTIVNGHHESSHISSTNMSIIQGSHHSHISPSTTSPSPEDESSKINSFIQPEPYGETQSLSFDAIIPVCFVPAFTKPT